MNLQGPVSPDLTTTTARQNEPCPYVPVGDAVCASQCAENEYCYKDDCMKLSRCPCVVNGTIHEVRYRLIGLRTIVKLDLIFKEQSYWQSGCEICACLQHNQVCEIQVCGTQPIDCTENEEYIKDGCCGFCKNKTIICMCTDDHTTPCATHATEIEECECIPAEYICDGEIDCANESDEQNCPTTAKHVVTVPVIEPSVDCKYDGKVYPAGSVIENGNGECGEITCAKNGTVIYDLCTTTGN